MPIYQPPAEVLEKHNGLGYSHDRWANLVQRTVAAINELGNLKGGEYANGSDRLDNFRRNGRDVDLPMEVIWRIYAGKHWDAITTYVKDLHTKTLRTRLEPISGRCDDLIVYLILLKAMIEERDDASNS